MGQKPNNPRRRSHRKNEAVNVAMNFLLIGCFAEIYLLALRKYYVYGYASQVLAWDAALVPLTIIGAVLAVLGLAAVLAARKKPGWKRLVGIVLLTGGAFLALASLLAKCYVGTFLNPACVVVPVFMLLGILWNLYDQECAYALTILGCTVLMLWFCRRGLPSMFWHNQTIVLACLFFAALAVVAFLTYRADKNGGMLGKIRFLPANADTLPIYVSCGIAAVAVAVALVSVSAAFYAIWAVALVIFALAIYYTISQL